MKFFTWLLLFIIGSIIVIFLVSPNTFKSIGDSISNIVKPTIANITQTNYVTIIPSQMQEYGTLASLYKSCADIEAIGQSNGVSDLRATSCQEACGKRSMNYGYYSCNDDLLTCYCSP
jgi:hypothetical protein